MKDMTMRKATLAFGLFLVFAVTACVQTVPDRTEAESLVARARWTVESFAMDPNDPAPLFRSELQNAHGVLIFPNLFKGAFLLGGEGGNGVLLTRDETGEWSSPAFYTMGSGSFGFQAGAQSSEVVLILRNQRAVEAVVYNQGKFGGDIQVTFGTLGAGIQGATTTAFGADIVGVARSVGLFAGFSLEGAALVRRNDLAAAYYGEPATPSQIVFDRQFVNPDADPLRRALALN
jgi:SH3 domain-containing YSC84-like protein 1